MAKGNHKLRKHAKLSASGAEKWINCTASPRLEETMPPSTSVYADEGTLAHQFGDMYLRWKNNEITEARYREAAALYRKDKLYSDEMEGQVEKYTSYVLEQFLQAQIDTVGAELWIEEKLDFSHIVPEGFGTGDAVILADETLEIIDLKYGRGVPISAENNSQLMLYALGALAKAELSYDIKQVKVTIAQVRLDSINSWELSTEDLLKWAEEVVRPAAELAIDGKGDTIAGSHCRWCRAKSKCKAFANLANEAAKFDFVDPELLTDAEMVSLFEKAPLLQEWVKSVSEYMHEKAKSGHKFQGYKLVNTYGKRKWSDEEAVIDALADAGFEPEQYTNTKLKGLTDISNLVSVDFFEENLKSLIIRPTGPLALVKESDKRPGIGTEQAKIDFMD